MPKKSITTLIILGALTLLVAVSALPQYVGGWPWASPPKLPAATRTALQAIPDNGLMIPGWVTDEQLKTKIGGDVWSIQQIRNDASTVADAEIRGGSADSQEDLVSPVFLLLRPQIYGADQPEVEWLDVKGSQQWSTDSYQKVAFEVPMSSEEPAKTARVNTDFFRAWTPEQTYAILQWYALPEGGSASPANWFWADQAAQWRHYQRVPWVAISVWLPIPPLGDITRYQSVAVALGETLQKTLMQSVFITTSGEGTTGTAH